VGIFVFLTQPHSPEEIVMKPDRPEGGNREKFTLNRETVREKKNI
jgi:hypothetical protein